MRWNELILIISQLRSLSFIMEDIEKISYQERCEAFNKNVVLIVRHFQYRIEMFFKVVVLNVQHYEILVEFQLRGSPHIY